MLGSLAGVIGGPFGVLFGAGLGALAGGAVDSVDLFDSSSMLGMVASKLNVGEAAVIALVEEDEPAFDAALGKYNPIIIRRDAAAVAEEVELALELAEELKNEEIGQLEAEQKAELKEEFEARKAELQEYREEKLAAINDRFAKIEEKHKIIAEDLKDNARARANMLKSQAEILEEGLEEHAKMVDEDDRHLFGF